VLLILNKELADRASTCQQPDSALAPATPAFTVSYFDDTNVF